ncbi:MAG TPA: 4Fe-4S dicluster domain-containing protein [Lachnospiraceae bacterium]
MDIKELGKILQENGIVGAGGAGFPTYAKLDERAETILLNCAECEPLLKLHRQLLEKYAYEITKTFQLFADILDAKEAIICVKKEYKETIAALAQCVDQFPKVRVHLLEGVYPMGDEVVMIYEATKKVVRPGGLPIETGVAVFNVETIYNAYLALENQHPVTDKVVSVVAEVSNPITVRVPIGCTIQDVVNQAGVTTIKDPVYFVGGPMMGNINSGDDPVTKTTNAILVLPQDHLLVERKRAKSSISLKRAASICCQCELCTDMCPRNMLGHPIEPHKFMRSAPNQNFNDTDVYLNSMFCCSCGVCELYACPQGLAPRTLLTEYKTGLRKAGVKIPANPVQKPVVDRIREFRKVPEERLEARLDLKKYNKAAPLYDEVVPMNTVKLRLSQHIGAPATAIVSVGDKVELGQMVAKPSNGLSVAIHASIAGEVTEVTDQYVKIQKMN